MSARSKADTIAAREVVMAFAACERSAKRADWRAAQALGCSPSWAKKIRLGTAERVSESVAARAALLRARIAEARREVAIIEGALHDVDLEPADALGVSAGRLVR